MVRKDFLEDERFKRFLETIRSDAFKRKLDELSGYTYEHTGEIRII